MLTSQQQSWLSELESEWLMVADRTDPMEPGRLQPLVDQLYGLANLPPPLLLIVDSPFAALAALELAQKGHLPSPFEALLRMQIPSHLYLQLTRLPPAQLDWHTPVPLTSPMRRIYSSLQSQIEGPILGELQRRVDTGLIRQFEDWCYRYQLQGQLRNHLLSSEESRLLDWVSWLDWMFLAAFGERLGLFEEQTRAELRQQAAFMGTGFWAAVQLRGLCILVNPPTHTYWEGRSEGRPLGEWRRHRLDGPALEFRDGYRLYRLAGAAVQWEALHWGSYASEPAVLDDPSLITHQLIVEHSDAEVRKAFILALDPDHPQRALSRFLQMTDTRVLDEDHCAKGKRRLLSLDVGHQQRWNMLELVCPNQGLPHRLWVAPDVLRLENLDHRILDQAI